MSLTKLLKKKKGDDPLKEKTKFGKGDLENLTKKMSDPNYVKRSKLKDNYESTKRQLEQVEREISGGNTDNTLSDKRNFLLKMKKMYAKQLRDKKYGE